MAELAGAVDGAGQCGRQNGRAGASAPPRTLDQIGVPLAPARWLLPLKLKNAQQGLFQRGMAGKHGVHKAHSPRVAVHRIVVQAKSLKDLDGAGEMAHCGGGIGVDVGPALVTHTIT
jgi:hypothetical protein